MNGNKLRGICTVLVSVFEHVFLQDVGGGGGCGGGGKWRVVMRGDGEEYKKTPAIIDTRPLFTSVY